MNKTDRKKLINLAVAQGAVFMSSFLIKRAFDYGYKRVRKQSPPKSIRSNDHNLKHIVGWSIFTGAVAGIMKLLTRDVMIYNEMRPEHLTEELTNAND